MCIKYTVYTLLLLLYCIGNVEYNITNGKA